VPADFIWTFGRETLIGLDQIPRDRLFEFGRFRLSTRAWTLEFRQRPLHISKYEFVLLLEFLQQPQTIIPKSFLVDRIWRTDPQIGNRALPVYVYRLNRILSNGSKQPRYIQSVRGMGYRLRLPVRVLQDSLNLPQR
jgi:DNA-binding response OmpR family regulator